MPQNRLRGVLAPVYVPGALNQKLILAHFDNGEILIKSEAKRTILGHGLESRVGFF